MRLLSPKEQKKTQLNDEIRRSLKVQKLVAANKEDLQTFTSRIVQHKSALQKEFDDFNAKIRTEKSILLSEVSRLEERKRIALEPLDDKWQELNLLEAQLEERGVEVNKQEQKVAYQKEELSIRKNLVEQKLIELAAREINVKEQEKTTVSYRKAVEDEQRRLRDRQQEFETFAANQHLLLLEREKVIADQQQVIEIEKEGLAERKTFLHQYKLQLDDRAATLERGFEELRTKQNGRSSTT